METCFNEIAPHPLLLDSLFAFRSKVSNVFYDVLGLYEINHIAITQIDSNHKILTFSSTPALEFNLFNSNLWRYDNTYQPSWFHQCTQASWESLYTKARYDELYYLKQIKHHYPLGYSCAVKTDDYFLIYSIASHSLDKNTQEQFVHHFEDFYKIGQYCAKMLAHLFKRCEPLTLKGPEIR